MIRFEKDRYVIEVVTGLDPIGNYLDLVSGLYWLIRTMPQDEVVPPKFYAVIQFLLEIVPESEDAKKIMDV